MCGSQVMRGLILETTRWRQWYQKTKKLLFCDLLLLKWWWNIQFHHFQGQGF